MARPHCCAAETALVPQSSPVHPCWLGTRASPTTQGDAHARLPDPTCLRRHVSAALGLLFIGAGAEAATSLPPGGGPPVSGPYAPKDRRGQLRHEDRQPRPPPTCPARGSTSRASGGRPRPVRSQPALAPAHREDRLRPRGPPTAKGALAKGTCGPRQDRPGVSHTTAELSLPSGGSDGRASSLARAGIPSSSATVRRLISTWNTAA